MLYIKDNWPVPFILQFFLVGNQFECTAYRMNTQTTFLHGRSKAATHIRWDLSPEGLVEDS